MSNGSYVRRAGITEVVLVPMLEASEDHVERLLAENERLRAALKRYGTHEHDCVSHSRIPCGCEYCRAPCDCGLDAAMKGDAK